ncbi:hypothetical protein QR680_007844 [Steinernema hermaphroditum]|uniref:Nematode cuticle collagen N-terminal domain-containing protein n=1 Tax=Steinernema hermaphroditum TaxID=289476 RepID=A0AA39M6S5_9BILA|nr:hypothetical protein QR680_007844 [Steinernema hermaphroditum]
MFTKRMRTAFLITLILFDSSAEVLRHQHHGRPSREKRELLSTSIVSAAAVAAIPTAIVVGGAAAAGGIVSALVTYSIISDSDINDTIQQICNGREPSPSLYRRVEYLRKLALHSQFLSSSNVDPVEDDDSDEEVDVEPESNDISSSDSDDDAESLFSML